MTIKTDLMIRQERIKEIYDLCVLDSDEHRVLRQQLDSLPNLGIEVVHTLVHRVNMDVAQYWRQRAESAEAWISGEKVGQ